MGMSGDYPVGAGRTGERLMAERQAHARDASHGLHVFYQTVSLLPTMHRHNVTNRKESESKGYLHLLI